MRGHVIQQRRDPAAHAIGPASRVTRGLGRTHQRFRAQQIEGRQKARLDRIGAVVEAREGLFADPSESRDPRSVETGVAVARRDRRGGDRRSEPVRR